MRQPGRRVEDGEAGAAGEADPRRGAAGEATIARWICDGARLARQIHVREPPARRGQAAAGEADPHQGAVGAARMGHGDEQVARRGDLRRREEERVTFASAVGEVTVCLRDPFLSHDPNM